MSIAVVQTSAAVNDGGTINTDYTPALDISAAGLVVVGVGLYAATPGAASCIVDTPNNLFTALTGIAPNTAIGCRFYYCNNPITSASYQVKYVHGSIAAVYPMIVYAALSGADPTSPFCVGSDAGISANSTLNLQVGPSTPSGAGDMFIAICATNNSDPSLVDSGFTVQQHRGNTHPAGNIGYNLATYTSLDGSAKSPTFSSFSDNAAAAIAAWKLASASGPTAAQMIGIFDQQMSGCVIGRVDA